MRTELSYSTQSSVFSPRHFSALHPQLQPHPVDEAVRPDPGPGALLDVDAGLADHAGAPGGVGLVERGVDAERVGAFLDVAHRDDPLDGQRELRPRLAAGGQLAD